ncbi:MAG: HAD hydrolase-like protein [Lachnospiraceae bacterium]|nr:HAD hydrolase-like protein [Lachnospiraceae bacterium]
MKKFILFDFDGTLFDTSPGILNCMEDVIDYYEITDFSLENLHLCIGPPLSWSFENLFHIPKDKIEEAINVYRKQYTQGEMYNVIPFKGMEECLGALKKDGYQISVCSSKPLVACEKILDKFGWRKYFDDICGAIPSECIETKEEVIDLFFKRHKDLTAKDVLLVGDTKYDALGAKEFNIDFLAVDYGFGSVEEMKEVGMLDVVSSPMEAYNYIEGLKD